MESDWSIRSQLRVKEWATSIDLRDAYLHIPIHPHYRKFLRLHIQGHSLQFRAMCFGLNVAPRAFTKLLQPVAAHIRSKGIRFHRYLDDLLIRGDSTEEVTTDTAFVLDLLERLGFLINYDKSDLVPQSPIVYLGMDIDFNTGLVRPSPQNLLKVSNFTSSLWDQRQASVRHLLSLLGLLNHAAQSVPLGRLHLRPLQFFVKAKAPNLKLMLDH